MNATRSLTFAPVIIVVACSSIGAQRRFEPRLPAPRDLQFYEPRNNLEDLESRVQSLLIKGRTYVGTLRVVAGALRVEATEIHEAAGDAYANGVVITFLPNESNVPQGDIRSAIDYVEIEPLIKALDAMVKADSSVTKLSHFELRYRTRGDFEAMIVKQLNDSVIVTIEGGFFDRTRFYLSPEELTKLRWLIAQAKDKLDEVK